MFRLPAAIRNLPLPVKVVGGGGLAYLAVRPPAFAGPVLKTGYVVGAAVLLGSAAADVGLLGRSGAEMLGGAARNPDGDESNEAPPVFNEDAMAAMEARIDADAADRAAAADAALVAHMRGAAPALAPRRTERDIGRYLDGLAHRFDDGGDPVMWVQINRARCSVNAGKPSAIAQLHAVEESLSERGQVDDVFGVASARTDLAQRWGMGR